MDLLKNLLLAADRAKAQESVNDHCQWCNAEITHNARYCEGTDCEYDGEKWRRAHYE